MTAASFFRVTEIRKQFGGLKVLQRVSFELTRGQIVGLVGPNGAGKTTLFNVVTGVQQADGGSVLFDDVDIRRLPGHRICRLGIARTFQAVRPFLDMTVRQNVLVGARFGGRGSRKEAAAAVEEAIGLVGLTAKADLRAGSLTLVDRKMVELARALATRPTLLLLDEILSGLNPTEMNGATALIRRLRDDRQITILWVEHVMRAVMATCERVIVLHQGTVLADGAPAAITADPAVITAYLGEKRTTAAR
jgi:branched-chain amino acid transport system ATP-binding protein